MKFHGVEIPVSVFSSSLLYKVMFNALNLNGLKCFMAVSYRFQIITGKSKDMIKNAVFCTLKCFSFSCLTVCELENDLLKERVK
jgi:hypothetical protein